MEHLISTGGYIAIFLLCVAQSACFPTSSEVTMGFAGVLAATGHLNLFGAIACGVSGEVVGAYIAWWVGARGGRSVIERYGRYILVTPHDLDRAEAWYDRHDSWAVFGGRCVPVIRSFVALLAGIAEVPAVKFGVLTFLGSLVWDSAMAFIGYTLGTHWNEILRPFKDAGYLIVAIVVLIVAAFIAHRVRQFRAHGPGQHPTGEGAVAVAASSGPASLHRSARTPPGARAVPPDGWAPARGNRPRRETGALATTPPGPAGPTGPAGPAGNVRLVSPWPTTVPDLEPPPAADRPPDGQTH